MPSYPSGQRGQTVNLLTFVFVGSNPTLGTETLIRIECLIMTKIILKLGELSTIDTGGIWRQAEAILFAGVLNDDQVVLVISNGRPGTGLSAVSYNLFVKVGQTAFIGFDKIQKTVKVIEIAKSATEVKLEISE